MTMPRKRPPQYISDDPAIQRELDREYGRERMRKYRAKLAAQAQPKHREYKMSPERREYQRKWIAEYRERKAAEKQEPVDVPQENIAEFIRKAQIPLKN